MPGMDFSGRTALVTGGGTGRGLAITRALGHGGGAVALAGRTEDQLRRGRDVVSREGVRAATFPCDGVD